MSASIESKAFFLSRCQALGFTQTQIEQLKDAGVETMGSMTFYCSYQPGSSDEAPLIKAAVATFNKEPPESALMIALRRLHYEAHAMFINDLKNRVNATEDEAPKNMPVAERAARHKEQQARLTGISIEGEMECSHSLLDLVMQQHEKNELKHVAISQCTSRDQELAGYKKDAVISLDSDGQLKLKAPTIHARADSSTDFRLYQAFNRRGLAYDQANLLPYVQHLK